MKTAAMLAGATALLGVVLLIIDRFLGSSLAGQAAKWGSIAAIIASVPALAMTDWSCWLRGHRWQGCTCMQCLETRSGGCQPTCICSLCHRQNSYGHHDWAGCVCSRCGRVRHEGHEWAGCKCATCGSRRDTAHLWDPLCVCTACGLIEHLWFDERCTRCSAQRCSTCMGRLTRICAGCDGTGRNPRIGPEDGFPTECVVCSGEGASACGQCDGTGVERAEGYDRARVGWHPYRSDSYPQRSYATYRKS